MLAVGCRQSDEGSGSGSNIQAEELNLSSLPQLSVNSADSLLFSPVEKNPSHTLPTALGDVPIIAFSFVRTEMPAGQLADTGEGERLHISLDESLTVSIQINRNQAVGDQLRSLSGSLLSPQNGIATFSVNREEDTITGMVDLLDINRLFYLRYDRSAGLHYIMEVDRSKLDTMEGSEPLEMDN
jgi:hypothetical protein